MYVVNIETSKKHPATIVSINPKEIREINKSKRFHFNWNEEKDYNVFKLTISNQILPVGLMSIHHRPDDFAIEIRLIAVSKENIGRKNGHDRIIGCLIAFACRESFNAGYNGFVFLKPKTIIKQHYISKYGFYSTRLYLVTEGGNSLNLIRDYYE